MEEFFIKSEARILALTKELELFKYGRDCFIDFIDKGSIFEVDSKGFKVNIHIEKEKDISKHMSNLSMYYSLIAESIDKLKLKVEPYRIDVKEASNKICIKVDIKKRDVSTPQRSYSHSMF